MTSIVTDIISEAADAALRQLPLTGDELEQAKALVMKAAISSAAIQRKFSYATSDKGFVAKAKGDVAVAPGFGAERDPDLPSLKLPTVVRKKDRKLKLQINQLMPPTSVDFFNVNYARNIDFDFAHIAYHDHPEAAVSRKIETEVVMSMLRSRHCDLLRVPTNGYDFSVIDSGGDWRYHHVRKHHGVHTDAPFLDDRDYSRDTRKRMQLTADACNAEYVCRELSQHCMKSAPFMMAVQSILYTTKLVEICETMASRGTFYFVGTMQLPEELRDFNGRYKDPHYGYTIEYAHRDAQYVSQYIPPQLRHGAGKYLFSNLHNQVMYRYPNGESREYVHDIDTLLEKLDPKTFIIPTAHGAEYIYSYKIVKRVGSLAYVEIQHVDNVRPAHSRLMVGVHRKPFDGYQISCDETLLRDFSVRSFRSTLVHSPRQLFTAVAAYCLTKVRDPSFQVEQAISYAQSSAAQIEANGVIIHRGLEYDSHALLVITGAAAFFWAFDRYRLMDSRLSSLRVADTQTEVQSSLGATIDSLVDFKSTFSALKASVSATLFQSATDYVVGRTTTYDDIRKMYESLTSLTSPGLHYIRDMHVCYHGLQELRVDGPHVAHQVGSSLVEAMVPTYPTYEYELPPPRTMGTPGHGLVNEVAFVNDSALGESLPAASSDAASIISGFDMAPAVDDMITMAEASEVERNQTAREVYLRVFDPERRAIRSMEDLKGTVKGQPTLLHYIDGVLLRVQTLAFTYNKGESDYDKVILNLAGSRFIYPEKTAAGVVFGTGVLRPDTVFKSDNNQRTSGQSFVALLDPSIKVQNSAKLRELRKTITRPLIIDYSVTELYDEVAGSGKTHAQCVMYRDTVEKGMTCAIFAATRAAAHQALTRLLKWGVTVADGSISSVDSFLMNPSSWRKYDVVQLDEALQLPNGKPCAVIDKTQPKLLRGYGDSKQIGYISFTRFHRPSVVTDFAWANVVHNMTTRRIPGGTVVRWLQSDILYGPAFNTLSPYPEGLQMYVQISSFESQLTIPLLYSLMGLRPHHQLLILVFLSDEVLRVRAKLFITGEFPTEEEFSSGSQPFMVAAKTVGESQGDDVDNSIILRMRPAAEPLYDSTQQTTVALTRHKRKLGIVMQTSKFPMLIEKIAGPPTTVPSLREAMSQKLMQDITV